MAWTICCVNSVIMIRMIFSKSCFLLTGQRNSCLPFVLIIIDFITVGFDWFWNELIDCVIFTKSGFDLFECNRSCLPMFVKMNDQISRTHSITLCYVFVCCVNTTITNCKRSCSIRSYLLLVKWHNKCIIFVFIDCIGYQMVSRLFDYDSFRPDSVVIIRT